MKQEQYKQFLEKSIKNIQKALNENYLSIFAGSGVSANSNLPNWSELMEKIAKELYGSTDINENNLILAEKFYNQFQRNHYYETLKIYIPNTAMPSDIHRKITRMNINNLITTNWDNLFEKAIADETRCFNIIKKDDDMGYVTGFAKLIKMHGDLDERNIVFREKDYLEYSDNFPLIENYIKGIFSTNLVVILGYSLNDNNVKQIISWVNYRSKDIKPVYFILPSKDFDGLEFDVYKHKNIHILYLNSLFVNEKDKEKKLGLFLDLIEYSEKQIDINELELQEIKTRFNNFLTKFKNCKFIIPELFVEDLRKYFKLNSYDISYNHNVIKITNKKMENIDEHICQKIADLTKATIHTNNKYINPSLKFDIYNDDLLNIFLNFDFKNIENKIQELSLKGISDDEELKRAFLLYKDEQYLESYETLKRVSQSAFKNRNYTVWYIAETNKMYFVFKNITEHNEKKVIEYLQEINKDDLEEKYLKLPKKQRFELKYIKDIELYIANNILNVYKLRDKIMRDYNVYENGGFSANNNMTNLLNILSKMFGFELNYCLMINLDDLYKNIAEGLLIDRFLDGLKQTNISKQQTYKSDTKAINIEMYPMLVYLVLKYFYKEEELKMILNDYGKKEYIFKFDNSGVETIFKNICDKFTKNGASKTYYSQLFNNFLIFTAWFELNQETFKFIIERVDNKLDNNLLGIPQYDAINYFLVYQYNKNKYKTNKICFDNIEKIICTYLEAFICGRFGGYNVLALQHSSVFHNMSIILKEKKIVFNANTNQKIRLFIDDKIEKFDIDTQQYYYENLLSKLYNSADSNTKAKIDKIKNNLEYNHKS